MEPTASRTLFGNKQKWFKTNSDGDEYIAGACLRAASWVFGGWPVGELHQLDINSTGD